jgi:hypothetical protein
MKRLNSSGYFLITMLLAIGLLFFGAFNFLNGMSSSYILIQRGIEPVHHITNNYSYYQNLKGFVFSTTFLVAAICFLIMILLPSERRKTKQAGGVPQPVYQQPVEDTQISAVIEQPDVAAIDVVDDLDERPAVVDPTEIEEIDILDEAVDDMDSSSDEDDDDVVYGTGAISSIAIMKFVNKFPDSALKFLYSKQLDGKMLGRADEDIYREWEQRGMSRGKVKKYILNLMDWKTFPKKPLYEIWKMLRDHIFDNVDQEED